MTQNAPVLSIVIVTWNVQHLLARLLEQLPAACAPFTWETIVVDNGSSDGLAADLPPRFPDVTWILNKDNPGYARANNQGLAVARGQFLLLLNPDTEPLPGSLATLVQFLQTRPQAGVVGPALILPDGTPQAYAFGNDPTPFYLLRRNALRVLKQTSLHDWDTRHASRVDWVSGACLLARRAVYETVGGLDETMFMYFEDNDWCLRARQANWDVWREPAARVVHIGGQSLKQNRAAATTYDESLRQFYRRHYGRVAQHVLNFLFRLAR